jgi:hypothetical protein
MRRESSTVVALVGDVTGSLLAGLARSPNVSVARAAGTGAGTPAETGPAAPGRGWEHGAKAMREAARRRSMYVIVPDDPLAEVAAEWRAMWDPSSASAGAAAFEQRAAEALAAWRGKQFELPDYYLVVVPALHSVAGPDLYLGPLRAARPHRVAVAAVAGAPDAQGPAASVVGALRSLEHGPWWPPLDELLGAAGRFYAGGLTAPGADSDSCAAAWEAADDSPAGAGLA